MWLIKRPNARLPTVVALFLAACNAVFWAVDLGADESRASAAGNSGGARVEVSADGYITAGAKELEAEYAAIALEWSQGGAVYPSAPDWSNSFRLQVGGLQVADMNGDGLNDVVVGCYRSNSFPPYDDWQNFIYLNTGGTLEADPSWTSSDEVSTGDIQVAHINDDPYPDIFAANGGFAMSPSVIYFGSASGPSTTPGWFEAGGAAWTNYAKPFDVDHDGDIDVVTANQGNSEFDPYRPMRMFENQGGVLDTVPSWLSAETSIQNFLDFADLDGDGWEDLAVSKWANFESAVYLNLMGTLETVPSVTTGDTDTDKGVAWADVDGDLDPDLALGHDPTEVYRNDAGVLTLDWSANGAFFGHSELRFEDVDRDGDPDLAEIHFSNGVVNLYRNNGGVLETTPSWSYNSAGAGTAIAFGDINGDEMPDLVVGNSGDVSVMVFFNLLEGPPLDFYSGFEAAGGE